MSDSTAACIRMEQLHTGLVDEYHQPQPASLAVMNAMAVSEMMCDVQGRVGAGAAHQVREQCWHT